LQESAELLKEVEVSADRPDDNVKRTEMSTAKLDMKTVQKLPVVFGEVDIIKTLQLLPGVIPASEASGGFHVRGGSIDQNLVLLDDAPVYNASHMVGFFSVFNADAIKDMKLYKGGIPAEYGGRISSILDIKMKEGNKTEYHGTAGIGLISSKLTVEGPVIKNKASFMIAGRTTYAGLLLPFSKDSSAKDSRLYFYDLNAKFNYTINENNRVFLSAYFGRDVVKLAKMVNMDYGNFTITNRWNHVFNKRVFLDVSTIYSNYEFNLGANEGLSQFTWITTIKDLNQRFDFTYYLNPDNNVKFGVTAIAHNFNPGQIKGDINDSIPINYKVPDNNSIEYGLYLADEQKLTSKITFQYGLRYSLFQNIGKGQTLKFDKSNSQEYTVTDTIKYENWKTIQLFHNGFEPRISILYTINDKSSFKVSYNRMIQYIHLASNSTASLPLDFWFSSSPNIKPEIGDQIALGYFRNFKNNMYETSFEVYYKNIQNSIDFRDHAALLINDAYEAEIRIGTAWSYGAEFYLKKQVGKFTGWISYTYSRIFLNIPEINDGKTYQAAHDKPHNLALVGSYDITDRLNISGNWIYTSAPPRTMPAGRWTYQGDILPVYSDRNTVRIFPYHRLDLSATLRLNKTKKKINHNLNLSVYNVYARKNPISIRFGQDPDNKNVTKSYITYLYSIIPSLSYFLNF
jgi:hypothetical protein